MIPRGRTSRVSGGDHTIRSLPTWRCPVGRVIAHTPGKHCVWQLYKSPPHAPQLHPTRSSLYPLADSSRTRSAISTISNVLIPPHQASTRARPVHYRYTPGTARPSPAPKPTPAPALARASASAHGPRPGPPSVAALVPVSAQKEEKEEGEPRIGQSPHAARSKPQSLPPMRL